MLRNKRKLMNRLTSGFMALFYVAFTVLSPLSMLPAYATESLVDLSYQYSEKSDVEIYVLTENESFSPGKDISIQLFVQNNSGDALTEGGLSWKQSGESLTNGGFVLQEGQDEFEINEKGSITNISLEPNEIFKVEFQGTVDEYLEAVRNRTISFSFGAKNSAGGAVTKYVEFNYATGLMSLLPVEFADGNVVGAGETHSMELRLALDGSEYFFNIETSSNATETDSDAVEGTVSDSSAEENVETDSNANVETDSNADEEVFLISKIKYALETIGVKFEDVAVSKVTAANGASEIVATVDYQVAADAEPGQYFGRVNASVKVNGKTYHVAQGFAITVEEGLTAEQLAEVQKVIDLINAMPHPDEIWAKVQTLVEAEDWDGYAAYGQEIARLAWPAHNAYMALNAAQKELVTNVSRLMDSAWFWSVVTLEVQTTDDYIAYSGKELYQLMNSLTKTSATLNEDSSITLEVEKTSTAVTSVIDPYLWLDLPDSVQGYKYIVVTYVRAGSIDANGKMQLFAVGGSNGFAAEQYSDYETIVGDRKYHAAYFDFSDYNGKITKIRFDYVDIFPDKVNKGDEQSKHGNVIDYSIDIDSIIFCKDMEIAERVSIGDRARESDKPVVENNSAIDFQLFNYSKYINKTEETDENKSWRAISDFFTFRGDEGESVKHKPTDKHDVDRDNRYDEDPFTLNHATVERNLSAVRNSEGGIVGYYPILDLTRYANGKTRDLSDDNNAAAATDEDRSLAYLFGGVTDHAVTVYNPENTILQYNEETGQYYYDSKNNAVDYNSTDNKFYLRDYVEKNSSTSGANGNKDNNGKVIPYYDFLPFNYTRGYEIGTNEETGINYNIVSSDVDYWFGMRMDVDFYQGKDGQYMDEEMVFHFTGDDDVWVFIDGILSLDLGGTHGAVTGSINFATGEVEQYLNWNGKKATTEGNQCYPTTLYDAFKAAYEEQGMEEEEVQRELNRIFESFVEDGKTYYRFKDYTDHNLSFFYMERGSSVANCSISFNLPTVPEESLTVTKEVEDAGNFIPDDTEYTFRVLQDDGKSLYISPDTKYDILVDGEKQEKQGQVSGDGTFTLKAGQSAQFIKMLEHVDGETEYYVEEVLNNNEKNAEDKTNWDYKLYYKEVLIHTSDVDKSYIPGNEDSDNGVYRTELLSGEKSKVVVFTNKVAQGDLIIEKTINRGDGMIQTDGTFWFELTSTNDGVKGQTYETNYISNNEAGEVITELVTFDDNGKTTVHVNVGTPLEIKGIPAGANIEIKEVNYAGFTPGWMDDKGTDDDSDDELIAGDTTKVEILSNGDTSVECVNSTGTVLPTTGGTGTKPYKMGGLLTIILAAGCLLLSEKKYRRKEEKVFV